MELLNYPFIRSALLMGVLLGALFSLMGMFVVTRGMAFFSDFIAHSVILGVALALILNAEPVVFLIFFSVAIAFLAASIWNHFPLSRDTVLGVLYGGTVAAGILLITIKHLSHRSLFQLLFGDILLITPLDIWLSAGLLAAFGLFLRFNLQKLVKASLIPDIAMAEGINVRLYDYMLMALMSLTIALSIKVIGAILANAMVIVPAATAKILSRNFRQFVILAPAIGVASFTAGLTASFYLDMPSGPSIVAASFLFFIPALPFNALRR